MRLLDAGDQLVAFEERDAPVGLVLVGKLDAETLLRDVVDQVPVVVQGGVDVQRDSCHSICTVRRPWLRRSCLHARCRRPSRPHGAPTTTTAPPPSRTGARWTGASTS